MTATKFAVSVRVKLRDPQSIIGIDERQFFTVNRLTLSALNRPPLLILSASGFDSEEEAERFWPNLRSGLLNIALTHQLAFKPSFERINIRRPDDPFLAARNLYGVDESAPKRVDGVGAGEGYYIHSAGEKITTISANEPSLKITHHWKNLKDAFIEGVCNGKGCADDGKLLTAFDLYLSSFYERTSEAQFITLVSCLEVLTQERNRHPKVIELFEAFEATLQEAQDRSNDEFFRQALSSAREDTRWKKKQSISERVRELVRSATDERDPESEVFVKLVNQAYGVRSKLLHNGKVDETELGKALGTIREAVRIVLASRLGLS